MMTLSKTLQESLQQQHLTLAEFQELIVRLLNYTVLCRSENATEQELYDRFVRAEDTVRDYLSIALIQVHHDAHFQYLRLYPPGAEIPGVIEADDSQYSGSLRQRLNQNEVALVLILRLQYDKSLREGKIDDQGYALESLESVSIAMKNMLRRALPEKLTERTRLFQRLRQLRLIQYRHDEEFANGESWIKIHPMIVTFVNEEALDALTLDDAERVDLSCGGSDQNRSRENEPQQHNPDQNRLLARADGIKA